MISYQRCHYVKGKGVSAHVMMACAGESGGGIEFHSFLILAIRCRCTLKPL